MVQQVLINHFIVLDWSEKKVRVIIPAATTIKIIFNIGSDFFFNMFYHSI
ncbi:hypothetical protein [Bacillus pseudomycoides]|nr:hypothetical protein [Bacillus pseudomycoides]